MDDSKKFCEKLKGIYPYISECGIDVAAEYDEAEQIWIVDFKGRS